MIADLNAALADYRHIIFVAGFLALIMIAGYVSAYTSEREIEKLARKLGATVERTGDRVLALTGTFSQRSFRIRFVEPRSSRSESETTIELDLHLKTRKDNSALSEILSLWDGEYMREFSDIRPAMVSTGDGKPERQVEQLWKGLLQNAPSYQRLFARGRLVVGESQMAWGCHGQIRNHATLQALLLFLSRIGEEVEKDSGIWVQARKGYSASQNIERYFLWVFPVFMVIVLAILAYIINKRF